MTDIAKCLPAAAALCDKRDTCYRYTAPANVYWQSYFTPSTVDGVCTNYWEMAKGEVKHEEVHALHHTTKRQ